MQITDVKIKLKLPAHEKLLGFAIVTFDKCFVVRDIKVIKGTQGVFVAMPSRKISQRCGHCGAKNGVQVRFCGTCGKPQADKQARSDERGRAKLHADIAHPINSRCRRELQSAILKAFHAEVARSKQPGYVPQDLGDLGENGDHIYEELNGEGRGHEEPPHPPHRKFVPEGLPELQTSRFEQHTDPPPPPPPPPKKPDDEKKPGTTP